MVLIPISLQPNPQSKKQAKVLNVALKSQGQSQKYCTNKELLKPSGAIDQYLKVGDVYDFCPLKTAIDLSGF